MPLQPVISEEAAADREKAQLRIEHGNGGGRVIDKQLEDAPFVAHGLAQAARLGHVADGQHRPVTGRQRGGGHGHLEPVAAAADQQGLVVDRGRRPARGQGRARRVGQGRAGDAVHQVHHLLDQVAPGRLPGPAGEGDGGRVEQIHPPLHVHGDDAVTHRLEDDAAVFQGGAGRGLGLVERPVMGLLLPLPEHQPADGDQRRQGREQRQQQAGAQPPAGKGLVPVDLGDHQPGGVNDGQEHRRHLHAPVVAAVHVAGAPLHRLHRDRAIVGERQAQVEGRVPLVAGAGEKEHLLPVAAHQQGFRTAAGSRPHLQEGKEEAGIAVDQHQAAERLPAPAGVVEQRGHRGGVGNVAQRSPVQVDEHRPSAGQGRVHGWLVPLLRVAGEAAQAQLHPGRLVHQQDVLDVVLPGQGGEAAAQVAAVLRGRCGQKGADRREQVRILRQGGGVLQLVGAPLADLVGLEPGDGGQLALDLEAHGLRLNAVQPETAGQQGQQGEQQSGLHPSRKHTHLQVGLLVPPPADRGPGTLCICIETAYHSTKICARRGAQTVVRRPGAVVDRPAPLVYGLGRLLPGCRSRGGRHGLPDAAGRWSLPVPLSL